MKLVSIFVVCIALTSVVGRKKWYQLDHYNFEQYVAEFDKVYSYEEYHQRKEIFESRLSEIIFHNADPAKTWKRGVNHLTDHTQDELKTLRGFNKAIFNNDLSSSRRSIEVRAPTKIPITDPLPASIDYRQQGAISEVKDQGGCGSCWAFATVETIESYYALLTGDLPVLSEQQVLDCTPNSQECGGKGGCMGGTAEVALEQLIKMGGAIASEWTYPYRSYNGDKFNCTFNAKSTPAEVIVTGYQSLGINADPEVLMAHLSKVGPLIVSVDASAWDDYEEGVFNGCNQTNPDLDHLVQLVGYGTTESPENQDYWIIRNSWRPSWGEHGYIRIARSNKATKQCGLDLSPLDGNGCIGGPPTVEVCGTCGVLYDAVYPIVTKP